MTGPTPATRRLVFARSEGMCEICCHQGEQIHHRKPRGLGGSSDPAINLPSNLALLCHRCHGTVESRRELAYRHGWLVHREHNPAEAPFLLLAFEPVYLTDSGAYERASTEPTIYS